MVQMASRLSQEYAALLFASVNPGSNNFCPCLMAFRANIFPRNHSVTAKHFSNYMILELNCEQHLLSKSDPHFLADSLRNAHGCHSAGLGAADNPILCVPIFMQVLGHLQETPSELPNLLFFNCQQIILQLAFVCVHQIAGPWFGLRQMTSWCSQVVFIAKIAILKFRLAWNCITAWLEGFQCRSRMGGLRNCEDQTNLKGQNKSQVVVRWTYAKPFKPHSRGE